VGNMLQQRKLPFAGENQ